jgi:protein transport protein SEC61 subunit alpha
MAGRFLKFFSPFVRITPEIKQPQSEVTFKDKIIYTFVVLIIYIVLSNIPLYGVNISSGNDYFYWLRVILASQRGTLTELGIGPIVTAGLIMQLLQGSHLIEIDMADPSDRALFTGAQKVLSIFLTIFQTLAYMYGGAFGDASTISTTEKILIFLQLLAAGELIILLDEMLQKGWGLGSGVSLFIAAGVAGQIFWNAFSYIPATGTAGTTDGLARGIVIALVEYIIKVSSGTYTPSGWTHIMNWWDLFIRPGSAPGLLGLMTTIGIFLIVVYFQTMNVEIPLQYAGYKGYRGKYPMKLLYVSNIPVILAQALYANALFFGELLAGPTSSVRTGHPEWSWWLNLIGTFTQQQGDTSGYLQPTGGLVYYLTAPQGLSSLINGTAGGNPALHAVVYLCIFLTLCVFFGKIWIEVSGLSPRDIAGQIIDSKMQVPGFRRSEKVIEQILKRYIPPLTILCGLIVGTLSFTADFLGALSTGTGLLLSVGIIQNYAESISKEMAADQYPQMRNLLGMA